MNIFKPPRSRHLSGKILLSLLWLFPIAVSLEPARSQEQGVTTIHANPEENAPPPTVASPPENIGTDDLGTPDPLEAGSVPVPSPPTEAATEVAQDAPDATTSLQVLFPQPAADGTLVLDRPSTNLVVEFTGEEPPEVLLNGKPLDEEILSQIERGEATSLATWYEVPLRLGENELTVVGADGATVALQVVVESLTAKIALYPITESRIPADKTSTVTLQGEITTEDGEPIQEELLVTLTAADGEFVGADRDPDALGFQVLAQGGTFTAELRSSLEVRQVRVRAALEGTLDPESLEESFSPYVNAPDVEPIEAYTTVEFVTYLRPSLVSGVVNLRFGESGTDFLSSMGNFLDPEEIDDGFDIDSTAALFATGRVGEWLLTGAFNSSRPINRTCQGFDRLFREEEECFKEYDVYGDSSSVEPLAFSRGNLYLRLERSARTFGAESDYFLLGDYNTTEFSRSSQLFTATDRSLHGFKANYTIGRLQATGFFSDDVQGFRRDTITPNGTSGLYFLSQRLVVPGSERVYLETREVNRPGVVLQMEELNRGVDYEIDYDRGTLTFRRPILALDYDPFGVSQERQIIVTYQFEGDDNFGSSIFAGRLQYNFNYDPEQASWIATSFMSEDEGDRGFSLFGVDARIALGDRGQVVAEYARSDNDSIFLGDIVGNAYRVEVQGRPTDWLNGSAYYRSVDERFANDATFSFRPGQTRYGAFANAQLGNTTRVNVQVDREINFGTSFTVSPDPFNPGEELQPGDRVDNNLTTIRAGIQQRLGDAQVGLEVVNRDREDEIRNLSSDSTQLVSSFAMPLTNRLTFRAQNEINLGSEEDVIYPDRTTFGLDWAVRPGINLRLTHQFFSSDAFDENAITSLDTIFSHEFSPNTSLTGRYSILGGVRTLTDQGAIGMRHGFTVLPGLRLNLGVEHVFRDLLTDTGTGDRVLLPYTVGQSSSLLGIGSGTTYSVGVEYTENPDFHASARFEHRTSPQGNNTLISAAASGKINSDLTALFRYYQADATNSLLNDLGDTINLKLGMAFRPLESSRFSALLRYEYRQNPSVIPDTLQFGSGTGSVDHLIGLEAIFAPSWQWEFYGKLALRNNRGFISDRFSFDETTSLAQFRTTYYLGSRWDITGQVRWLSQATTDFDEVGLALEAGYFLTPNLRLSAGYSFGDVDDGNLGNSRTEDGLYFGVTMRVDNLFGDFGQQKPRSRRDREVITSEGDAPATSPSLPSARGGAAGGGVSVATEVNIPLSQTPTSPQARMMSWLTSWLNGTARPSDRPQIGGGEGETEGGGDLSSTPPHPPTPSPLHSRLEQ